MVSRAGSSLLARLVRLAVLALGVVLATKLVPGIRCDDGATLIAVVVVLTLFNLILKPLLVFFTLPFIIATLGLGLLVINALLFLLVGKMVEGFHVATFGAAMWGSLVVSGTNFLVNTMLRGGPPTPPGGSGGRGLRGRGDRGDSVIDI